MTGAWTEPCDLSAVEARARIAAGTLSPAELLESCIARTEAVDHAVNALPVRDFVRARAAAGAHQRASGLTLGGLPVGAKLSEDVRDLPSTHGSPIYADAVAAADSPLVARLRSAGGIIFGKTNAPEFNAGGNTRNVVHGATGNPFDPRRSAAGSSGGSAVALACGMVPLATGSDLGGSLRNPAAFCGVVGMRPSPGTIADPRAMGFLPLSVAGPMARTVDDVALLLAAMTTRAARPVRPPDLAALRIAVTPDFGFAALDGSVRDTFARIVDLITPAAARVAGATPDCAGVARAFAVLRGVLFLGAHATHWRDHRGALGTNVAANYGEALDVTAADVADALLTQTAFAARMDDFFAHHDLLLAPAVAIAPPPWTERSPATIGGRAMGTYYEWLGLAYPATLAGHPALSLPVGCDAGGMPFGLQLIAARDADWRLLAMAGALEAHFAADRATARPVPDLAALRASPPIAHAPGFLD